MTTEEKAKELYDKFYNELFSLTALRPRVAKQCALIAVEEITELLSELRKPEYTTFIQKGEMEPCDGYEKIAFYEQVYEEINKL